MTAKNSPDRRTKRTFRTAEDRAQHRWNVALEEVNSRMASLAEGLTMRDSLTRKLDRSAEDARAGFDLLTTELTTMRGSLERRLDALEANLDSTADASRVAAVESGAH